MSTIKYLILLFIISYIAVWGYAIYDVTKTKFKSKNIKIIWTVLIFSYQLPQYFISFIKKSLYSCIFIQAKKVNYAIRYHPC